MPSTMLSATWALALNAFSSVATSTGHPVWVPALVPLAAAPLGDAPGDGASLVAAALLGAVLLGAAVVSAGSSVEHPASAIAAKATGRRSFFITGGILGLDRAGWLSASRHPLRSRHERISGPGRGLGGVDVGRPGERPETGRRGCSGRVAAVRSRCGARP